MRTAEEIMHALFGFTFSQIGGEVFIPIIAIIMVFSIPIAAIITEHFQKQAKAKLMEKAIEQGVPVENLKFEEPKRRLPYRSGMVTAATGLGIIVFGFAMGTAIEMTGDPEAIIGKFVMGGMGAIVLLIGIALLVNDKMNYDRIFRNGNGNGNNGK